MDARPDPTRSRIATRFCQSVVAIVLGALLLCVLKHDWSIVRHSTPGELYPMPIYGIVTSEDPPAPAVRGASGPDYSQIFTAAMALRHGQSAYRPKDRRFADRWGRPPGMPPLTNWLNVPMTYLPYGTALVIYTVVSILGLFGATALLLYKTHLLRHLGRVFFALGALFFLTPIGVTYLERGQSDLLVATASLLCVTIGLAGGPNLGLALATGVLGAMKWTAAPFLGCYAGLGFLLSTRKRRWAYFLIPVVMAALTLSFWQGLKDYWVTISYFELNANPWGITMRHLVSRNTARVLPALATAPLLGLALLRAHSAVERGRVLVAISAPAALAITSLAVCYNTLSYEYHTVMLLGILPIVVVWVENVAWVSNRCKVFVCAVFVLLLAIAFRVYGIANFLNEVRITYVYAVAAVLFWLTAAYIALMNKW